ncbi:hypothetical protein [Pseudooceanicola sp. LIPI14-2-Ac024]|uniref:hypothetical protein n=1 Tax=Pseudooceanicola sp. LIPI14-2-Ac024 TaxID=3344875 RepID=UPI0035CF2CB0
MILGQHQRGDVAADVDVEGQVAVAVALQGDSPRQPLFAVGEQVHLGPVIVERAGALDRQVDRG